MHNPDEPLFPESPHVHYHADNEGGAGDSRGSVDSFYIVGVKAIDFEREDDDVQAWQTAETSICQMGDAHTHSQILRAVSGEH